MDNHFYNDVIMDVLDICDRNCSSALVQSLENLLKMAKDPNRWKEIDGKLKI